MHADRRCLPEDPSCLVQLGLLCLHGSGTEQMMVNKEAVGGSTAFMVSLKWVHPTRIMRCHPQQHVDVLALSGNGERSTSSCRQSEAIIPV
jgi:hypothetical protein